jgi:regulator of nucleoside diphosphate kinase
MSRLPPLVIRRRDEQRLHEFAIGAMLSAPRVAGGLMDELARAEVWPDETVPADVVGLGSLVLCLESDGEGERYHRARLVSPDEADAVAGRLSVVSDLGAALIGLAAGQAIVWRDRRGGERRIAVLEVDTQS